LTGRSGSQQTIQGTLVNFSLIQVLNTQTIRTTPAGTRFMIKGITVSGRDTGAGGGIIIQLQINGVTVWAWSGGGPTLFHNEIYSEINAQHIGDGVEIIRIVASGSTADALYSCTIWGFDY